jgi:hypothetical protein
MIRDDWLSIFDSPSTVALTAPFLIDKNVLIGYGAILGEA